MHIHTGIKLMCTTIYIVLKFCIHNYNYNDMHGDSYGCVYNIIHTYNNTIIQLRGSVSDHDVYLKQLDVTCILPTPLVALMTNMGVVSCQLEHRSLEILLVASQIDVIGLLHNAQISSALPQTA